MFRIFKKVQNNKRILLYTERKLKLIYYFWNCIITKKIILL